MIIIVQRVLLLGQSTRRPPNLRIIVVTEAKSSQVLWKFNYGLYAVSLNYNQSFPKLLVKKRKARQALSIIKTECSTGVRLHQQLLGTNKSYSKCLMLYIESPTDSTKLPQNLSQDCDITAIQIQSATLHNFPSFLFQGYLLGCTGHAREKIVGHGLGSQTNLLFHVQMPYATCIDKINEYLRNSQYIIDELSINCFQRKTEHT